MAASLLALAKSIYYYKTFEAFFSCAVFNFNEKSVKSRFFCFCTLAMWHGGFLLDFSLNSLICRLIL